MRKSTTMIPQRASYVFILKPSFKWAATGHSLPCRVSNLAGSFLTNLKFCLSTTGIPTILGFWEDGYHGITRPKNRYPQTWCLVSLKKVSPAANMEIWRHLGLYVKFQGWLLVLTCDTDFRIPVTTKAKHPKVFDSSSSASKFRRIIVLVGSKMEVDLVVETPTSYW